MNKNQIPMEELSDDELVRLSKSNDRRAQETLYRRYAKTMYRIALIYTDCEADACDVLQESFIKFFRKLSLFQFESSLKTWLRAIVVNTAISFYRKQKKEKENTVPILDSDYPEKDNIISNLGMTAEEIVKHINKLPQKARLVLKLYAIEGYGHKEIADSMGISEGTSKSQLNRARLLLLEFLKQTNE